MKIVYKEIARLSVAYGKTNYEAFLNKLNYIENGLLPSGSGLDAGTTIDYESSNENRIRLVSSFHVMDENGFYDGWIDFEVIVKPSLMFDFNLTIKGRFGKKHQNLKDYLYTVFSDALQQPVKYPDTLN